MPAAGFANVNNGVVIDMTGLDSITVESSGSGGGESDGVGSEIVKVGGGAKWLDVYRYLDAYNITVAGGRNGDVGVGGLLLGGGISYFGPRVGWACDGAVNFEVCALFWSLYLSLYYSASLYLSPHLHFFDISTHLTKWKVTR